MKRTNYCLGKAIGSDYASNYIKLDGAVIAELIDEDECVRVGELLGELENKLDAANTHISELENDVRKKNVEIQKLQLAATSANLWMEEYESVKSERDTALANSQALLEIVINFVNTNNYVMTDSEMAVVVKCLEVG